jgi:TonB family protein
MNGYRERRLLTTAICALATCQPLAAQERGTRPHEPVASVGKSAPPSSAYDVPPKLLSGRTPIYPITRLQRGEGGDAIIDFTVDAQGIPRDFRVVKADYPYFASHAIIAMRDWRYQPAMKNGKPVAARLRIPFHYRFEY